MLDQLSDNPHISFLSCHHEGCLLRVLNQIDNSYLKTAKLNVSLFLSSEQNTINFTTEKAYVMQAIWSHNQQPVLNTVGLTIVPVIKTLTASILWSWFYGLIHLWLGQTSSCSRIMIKYTKGTHFIQYIVTVLDLVRITWLLWCVDHLLWQVCVSICLQQYVNNIFMFLVYCTVKGCPQLSVVLVHVFPCVHAMYTTSSLGTMLTLAHLCPTYCKH